MPYFNNRVVWIRKPFLFMCCRPAAPSSDWRLFICFWPGVKMRTGSRMWSRSIDRRIRKRPNITCLLCELLPLLLQGAAGLGKSSCHGGRPDPLKKEKNLPPRKSGNILGCSRHGISEEISTTANKTLKNTTEAPELPHFKMVAF